MAQQSKIKKSNAIKVRYVRAENIEPIALPVFAEFNDLDDLASHIESLPHFNKGILKALS